MFWLSMAVLIVARFVEVPWWIHQVAMIVLVLHIIWYAGLIIISVIAGD